MQVRFLQNLGITDAADCKDATGAKLDHKDCVIDAVVDVPVDAAEWLQKKHPALFERVDRQVRGNAKDPAIAGVKS